MNDWWKNPVLQGPENDYGDYDYLIEEIPENYARWEHSKYRWKCDDCGKERHLLFCATQYFHTLDGWDSLSWNTCWKCYIKGEIKHIKWKIKHGIKIRIIAFKDALRIYRNSAKTKNFKYWYNLMLDIQRRHKK